MKVLFPGSTSPCVEDAQEFVQLHNKALSELLQELEGELKGFKYADHDFFTSISQRFNNPSKYGMPYSLKSFEVITQFLLCTFQNYPKHQCGSFIAIKTKFLRKNKILFLISSNKRDQLGT